MITGERLVGSVANDSNSGKTCRPSTKDAIFGWFSSHVALSDCNDRRMAGIGRSSVIIPVETRDVSKSRPNSRVPKRFYLSVP